MELLTPGFGLVVWTVITFLILFFLLKKFAWKPILGAVHDRETSIKSALDSAEAARREMENLQADNERILQEARTERDSIIKEADASDEAQAKADQIIKQAQAAILSEKQAAIADIKNQVANLSIDIAEKVVREELSNKEKQAKLVEDMLGDVTLN